MRAEFARGKGNMLKLKYLFENFDLAKECLGLYDPDWAKTERLLQYFRVSSNAVYPFRTAGGKVCFLRLSPAEEKPAAEVEWEARLAEWLNTRGFNAMKPYPMRDGSVTAVRDTRWGIYNVSCYEAVDGETLEDCEGGPDLVRGCGRTLGLMHRHLKECPFGEERRDHRALMDETRERLLRYGAPESLLREWESVNEALSRLPVNAGCYGVVHYDFEADNVLFNEKTGAFGVIDFDDAIRCWYALDLARAIDCLDDAAGDEDLSRAEEDFLAGYLGETELPAETVVAIPLMRRLVRLQEYATILHVLSGPADCEPDWMTEIILKLRGRLRAIENELRRTRGKD